MPLIECFFVVVSTTLQAQLHDAEQAQSRKRGRESEETEGDAKVGDDSKESEHVGEAKTADTADAPQPNLGIKVQPYIPGERFRQSEEFQQMQMEEIGREAWRERG